METKFFLSFILISSWVFLGFSVQESEIHDSLGPNLDSNCLSKLVPCQSSLKNPTVVSSTCCVAVKDLLQRDPKCLCDMISNTELLKKLEVSQNDLLNIPVTCGMGKVDPNPCSKLLASSPNGSPTAAVVPENGTHATNSTGETNSANGISPVNVSGLVASFVMLLSAF